MCECKCGDQVPGLTITESRLAEVLADENWTFTPTHYFRVFSRLGITVVPDPEPTNAEQLDRIYQAWRQDTDGMGLSVGEWMENHGVTAPGASDE